MGCDLEAARCRREHIAVLLEGAEPNPRSPGDWEARCPGCGHRAAFALSAPTHTKYRNIWGCACKRCGCQPGALRALMLGRGIRAECLGLYDGPDKVIQPEAARRLDLAVRDILAAPGLKPSDIRIVLADAMGRKVPEDYSAFVQFARSIGIGKTQAQEAAARWGCRPSD